MKSDVIAVSSGGEGMEEALRQTEDVASYKKLDKKNALHLRLLGEEMMGMLRSLTGETEASFWIEDNKQGVFELHLKTVTVMDAEKRGELLKVSTSGKNSAAKGIMGKIRDIFESMLAPDDLSPPNYYESGLQYDGFDMTDDPMKLAMISVTSWSLEQYRESVKAEENSPDKAEEWDELEKSIVANLADEVKIFINGNAVEMVIYKKIS